MDLEKALNLSEQIAQEVPFVNGVETHEQYLSLIDLLDELTNDPVKNEVLINLLFPIAERYEEESEYFAHFNQRVEHLDQGVAMLRVIIDQHQLTLSDLPEIGKKSNVSLILSGKRSLTLNHIHLLSQRFGIPKYMFV